ncbi:MAG: hypothetical protein ACK4OJ_13925, partial [Brevundimonas sp.]
RLVPFGDPTRPVLASNWITVSTSGLVAGDVDPNAPGLSDIKADITEAFGDISDVSDELADARADLDAQGVEIAAARGGQASLNARIVQVNQAAIDGDEANAEAISLVQARTANTEADIIDLETALATETGARAEAINQVTARQNINPNLLVGGSGERGVSGWDGSGGLQVGSYPTVAPSYFYKVFPAGAAVDDFHVSPKVWVEGLSNITVQWAGAAYAGATTQVWVAWYDGAGVYVGETARFALASGSPQTFARPSGATFASWVVRTVGAAPTAYADVVFHSIKIEKGSVATIYSTDATQTAIAASVTEQSLAIIDLETQQALAYWGVTVAASGGNPARIGVFSSTIGAGVIVDAPYLYWGDNTVFDNATDTLQTTIGGYRRVLAFGAPFGDDDNLLDWWGPDSIALGSMTTANGLNGRMTTAPYVFDNATPSTGGGSLITPASSTTNNATSGATWVTWASVSFTAMPVGGLLRPYVDVFGVGAEFSAAGLFSGNWRLLQGASVIASGSFSGSEGSGVDMLVPASPLTPAASGSTTISLQAQRASGTINITGGVDVSFYAEWTKAA